MNRLKVMRISLGVVVVYLVISGLAWQTSSERGAIQASGEGTGNSEVYLSIVLSPLFLEFRQ